MVKIPLESLKALPPNPLAMARWSQGRHGQWRELVVLALRRTGERGGSGGAADR